MVKKLMLILWNLDNLENIQKKLAITCTLSSPPHLEITNVNNLQHKFSALNV